VIHRSEFCFQHSATQVRATSEPRARTTRALQYIGNNNERTWMRSGRPIPRTGGSPDQAGTPAGDDSLNLAGRSFPRRRTAGLGTQTKNRAKFNMPYGTRN